MTAVEEPTSQREVWVHANAGRVDAGRKLGIQAPLGARVGLSQGIGAGGAQDAQGGQDDSRV